MISRMDDPMWYSPDRRPPAPRQPKPGEHVWTLQKGFTTAHCELRSHGDYGCEAQTFEDGEFVAGRRFDTRAEALEWAASERAELERDGWT
jgi:hypothetical protein